jgi:Flp pilus assembly protein TadD
MVSRDVRGTVLLWAALAGQAGDYQQGVALIEKGRPAEAVDYLTRAAANTPADARVWKALGVAHAAQGDYGSAEPAFGRACALDPRLRDACYYHGRALYALDRYEASIDALRRAPDSWLVRLGMAQSLEALGRAAESEKEYARAEALGRGASPQPGTARGKFLIRQGRFAEASALLANVVKRFPAAPEANALLGRALLEEGRIGDAIRHLERAVEGDPRSAQAHLLLAKAYVRAGREADARPHFEAAARFEEATQRPR